MHRNLSEDLVVFSIVRDSKCAECGKELQNGDHLFMGAKRPLCLMCADLDHLVYLPSGDTALTRRARKHSTLSAVVLRFSRSRRRHERQGVLVEEAALQRAEEECLADAERRAGRRKRDEVRRIKNDRNLVAQMADAILKLFPSCPAEQAHAIAEHTAERGSGRVGRTAAGQALDEEALTNAVIAHVRHNYTNYDRLLMTGYSRTDAREAIRDDLDKVLQSWRRVT